MLLKKKKYYVQLITVKLEEGILFMKLEVYYSLKV